MKIFFDTEFTGLHQHTTLISIGCLTEGNQEFYAELTDYDQGQVDTWIKENVISNLELEPLGKPNAPSVHSTNHHCGNTEYIKRHLSKWFSQYDSVQMISDCLSYDWVLFCQIWGHAFNIPSNVSPHRS